MKKLFLIPIIAVLLIGTVIAWSTEHLISLQGYVTDSSDIPVETGDLGVRIYDNDTNGNEVLNETYTGGVKKGIFDVLLGSQNPLYLDNTQKYYMEVSINGQEVIGDETSGRQIFYPGGGSHALPEKECQWENRTDEHLFPHGWCCVGTCSPQGEFSSFSGGFVVPKDASYRAIRSISATYYKSGNAQVFWSGANEGFNSISLSCTGQAMWGVIDKVLVKYELLPANC
jgi:hypothetical protein